REPEVTESRKLLEESIEVLAREYAERPFLVGEQFTRADLAAASLLGPLIMPPEYGLQWPDTMPEPLQSWVDQQAPLLSRYSQLYADFR
ncbi:MAG: glutathione binding-like protein, partial [Alcanivorax nanhaiticus]